MKTKNKNNIYVPLSHDESGDREREQLFVELEEKLRQAYEKWCVSSGQAKRGDDDVGKHG